MTATAPAGRPRRRPPYQATDHLPGGESILDVGCNGGELLRDAHRRGYRRLYGVDINPAAVARARENLAGLDAVLTHGSADELPLPDGAVDVVTCTEVLEHVPEALRPGVVRETHRVLAPGGRLVLTVPHRGRYHFLDPANLRLRFPWLFRAANRLVGGRGREAGYEGQKHGLVWHHHFTLGELRGLLGPYFDFEVVRFRGALQAPLLHALHWPFYRRKATRNRLYRLIDRAVHRDMARDPGPRLGYNVLLVARKKGAAGGPS